MFTALLAMVLLQEPPVREEPKLTFQSGGKKGTVIQVTADVPDGAEVTVNHVRLDERMFQDRIEPVRTDDMDQKQGVFSKGKMILERRFHDFCHYEVEVCYDAITQCEEVFTAQARKIGIRDTEKAREQMASAGFRLKGQFRVEPRVEYLSELAALGQSLLEYRDRAADLLERCASVIDSPESFESSKDSLRAESRKLMGDLGSLVMRTETGMRKDAVYTAAVNLIKTALSELDAYLGFVEFDAEGNRKAKIDYHTGKPIESATGGELNLDHLREDVKRAKRVLIREAALFVPKCLHDPLEEWRTNAGIDEPGREKLRTYGQSLADVIAAVRGETPDAPAEAASAFALKLAAPPPEEGKDVPLAAKDEEDPEAMLKDLDELEKRLRSLKAE